MRFLITFEAFFLLLPLVLWAQEITAFTEAQGSGAETPGGRGGRIIEVTNLDDSGPGSLREALLSQGARIVVFRTGGTIELESELRIWDPFITVAGQTAPGGGITLSGKYSTQGIMAVSTHDVVIRYIRSRKGYNSSSPSQSGGCGSIISGAYNVIFDHCSFSWTQDENSSIWGNDPPPHDITYSWNFVAEPLAAHPTNIITGSNSSSYAAEMSGLDFHHNLLANSSHRNPLLKNASTRWVNNITYNWSYYAFQQVGGGIMDVIGNFYKRGPINGSSHEIQLASSSGADAMDGESSVYLSGNKGPNQQDPAEDQWIMANQVTGENGNETGAVPEGWRRDSPLAEPAFPIAADPVDDLENIVLPIVGASRRLDCEGNWVLNRDGVDLRIMDEYENNGGFVPETEDDVGGYPLIEAGIPCGDSDHDGMPDAWEEIHGFTTDDPSDGNTDADEDGYTNIEEFLNGSDPHNSLNSITADSYTETDAITLRLLPQSVTLHDRYHRNIIIRISDINGRLLITHRGRHTVILPNDNFEPGVNFITVRAGNCIISKIFIFTGDKW
jgi:hypothetical protein